MNTNSEPTVTVDNAAIIARGYVLEEEYRAIGEPGKMTKLNLGTTVNKKLTDTEGIWVYALEDDSVARKKFHFVFFNDPIAFMGCPRAIAGMVGIATSRGSSSRAEAEISDCLDMFEKTGPAAIQYFRERLAAHKETEKETKPDA